MKLIPLGGAEEVGATCTLVEIGGHKILVDAGIRLNQPDALPDLARISDFGGIEAILVTHAHTDHTGALPVVHRAYPNIPVIATPGTQAIVNVLFNDALNIMKSRYELDREIPLYNKELVDSLFSRMQSVQLGQTVKLFGGDVAATFFPAGHILGAACIGLQSASGESAFISGDISVTPQLTVGGMLPPVAVDRRFRPQVVMVESTYGNRMHANRASEERRLVETVAGVVERGGRVLIPAFAVGRAQEILLILAGAMARKAIAPFPVWVDGMVRSVCGVYTQHPYDLAAGVRRQIVKQGNPFFGESAGVKEADFTAITTTEERQKLAENKQAGVIVASSGMLSGGPSAFYARYIVKETDSAIFITGYQDEESPGRALLDLAEAAPADRMLKLDGEATPVACQVGKYSLSAHVDAGEVAGLIDQLDPQETILVHGAGGAREALSDLLVQTKDRRIYLPTAGDELNFEGRKKHRFVVTQPQASPEAGGERPKLPESAAELAAIKGKIQERFGPNMQGRTFTVQELAHLWLEASNSQVKEWPGGMSAEEYSHLRELLNQKESGFMPDKRRPFLYRAGKVSEKDNKGKAEQYPLEQNQALAAVEKLLPPSTGLYRRGAATLEKKLILYFNFPEVAAQKYRAELEELAKVTGWAIELNAETHQGALTEALRRVLPETLKLLKAPGVYREAREVRATLEYVGPEGSNAAEAVSQLCEAFKAETGWILQPAVENDQPPVPVGTGFTGDNPESVGASFTRDNQVEKLEINAAFAAIERTFYKEGDVLLKKSLKRAPDGSQFIELGFVTPQLGERYQSLIDQLQSEVGWPIRVNPEPNQQGLQRLGEQVLKEAEISRYAIKGWSIHRDKRELGVKLDKLGTEPDPEALQKRFNELTGWTLKL